MNYVDQIRHICDTETGPYRRPFSPNPQWQTAEVMIVGTNPATPMREEFDSFDQYWRSLTVDPKIYWDRYRVAHSGGTSKSTGNANLLLKLLEPSNVLLSNVVWFPVQKKKHIPKAEWRIGIDFLTGLFRYVNPKVVFCHGADAEKFAKSLCPNADRYKSVNEQRQNILAGTLVLCYHHFSGQGLRAGTRFQPRTDFPAFAEAIHEHLSN